MTLLPRSLFSRLVLVLLAVLLAAQLMSFAIHMHERGELLQQASGMQSARRIAEIVRVLDSLGREERARMAGILSTPPMAIRLDEAPLRAGESGAETTARATMFAAMLRRFLGEEWPLEVAVADSRPFDPGALRNPAGPRMGQGRGGPGMGEGMGGPGMGMHSGVPYSSQPALSFIAQVRLRDGTLVTFDSRQAAETENWPYRLMLSLAVLLAAVIGVSLVAVRWATRPLKVLADAAEELGKDIHRPPLAESGPVEVARAARAFNTMQSRLVRFIEERTRALAAMSHDLKTPITRLRLRAELLDDASLRAKFTGDLAEMESMVGATLDFMRGIDTGEAARPIDIQALLESLQADLQETGGRMSIEGNATGPYVGRPQALKRCLANLLQNAINYGGSAAVAIDDNADRLVIRITDEGPGIPEQELERVFEPFYRLEGSRNRETGGTGLGLGIARSIAEAHGGHLRLRNRAEGGLEAALTLPRSGSSGHLD
jgi:signal transduction histidine kinase